MAGRMNAADRAALRAVVKQRMKVLRNDVRARHAEMISEVREKVAERYAARDKVLTDTHERVFAIVDQANKDLRATIESIEKDFDVRLKLTGMLPMPGITTDQSDRRELYARLIAKVEAQVADAMVSIDRQEADLIEELTVDGLESVAAKQFLNRIPTVGQLVPASRMKELAG